ncbi:MAG: hypothetical protein M1818_003434 [Claussenomyces sp. TS43310]|nr:MAG: hypothetical protein M1818_003434 [Claussenomyces sp. TS43310]
MLDDLVRLCGSSPLYLPPEYAAGTLRVPTCFRATAQYLIQHAPLTRGIFRIPGSKTTVDALYNHYAAKDEQREKISDTVRCPVLPEHIRSTVHDVASAFKRFLAGLPKGILGSGWLFDAFIAIYGMMGADRERTRTKLTKLRARLIALAIASIPSRHEREFICAVMGLLCMVGRTAETARKEDDQGRLLPTSDLMGYEPLGVIFGPLLTGDLLEDHGISYPQFIGKNGNFHAATYSPTRSWRGPHRKSRNSDERSSLQWRAEQIRLANSVTEMLITNWLDIVRQVKSLGALRSLREHQTTIDMRHTLRPYASESFMLRKQPGWNHELLKTPSLQGDILSVGKRTSTPMRPRSGQNPLGGKGVNILTPTAEESNVSDSKRTPHTKNSFSDDTPTKKSSRFHARKSIQKFHVAPMEVHVTHNKDVQRQADGVTTSSLLSSVEKKVVSDEVLALAHESNDSPSHSSFAQSYQISHDDPSISMVSSVRSPATDRKKIVQPSFQPRPASLTTRSLKSNTPSNQSPTPSNQYLDDRNARPSPLSSSSIPEGIVGGRLRRLVASDPGNLTSSESRVLLPLDSTDYGNLMARTPLAGSPTLMKIKDPRSQMKREDDLTSLAGDIESEGDIVANSSGKIEMDSNQNRKPAVDGCNSDPHIAETTAPHAISRAWYGASGGDGNLDIADSELMKNVATPLESEANPTLHTPNEDCNLTRKGNTVKELAAKFDKTYRNMSPTPPSKKRPNYGRASKESGSQSSITSSYISNLPITLFRSIRPQRSLQNINSPRSRSTLSASSPARLRQRDSNSSLVSKPLTPWKRSPHDLAQEKWSNKDQVDLTRHEISIPEHEYKGKTTSSEGVSRLHGGGTSSGSLAVLTNLDFGTRHQRSSLAPISQDSEHSQVSSALLAEQAPFPERLTPRARLNLGIPENDAVTNMLGHKKSIYSMLYDQIQSLQIQLDASNDEVDALKGQIHTQGSLKDVAMLKKGLDQAMRDLKLWKDRAIIAESTLDMLLSLPPDEEVDMTPSEHISSTERKRRRQLISSNVKGSEEEAGNDASSMQSDVWSTDVERSEKTASLEHEGTVRRTGERARAHLKRAWISYDGMYDDEDKENVPPPLEQLYELE